MNAPRSLLWLNEDLANYFGKDFIEAKKEFAEIFSHISRQANDAINFIEERIVCKLIKYWDVVYLSEVDRAIDEFRKSESLNTIFQTVLPVIRKHVYNHVFKYSLCGLRERVVKTIIFRYNLSFDFEEEELDNCSFKSKILCHSSEDYQ